MHSVYDINDTDKYIFSAVYSDDLPVKIMSIIVFDVKNVMPSLKLYKTKDCLLGSEGSIEKNKFKLRSNRSY